MNKRKRTLFHYEFVRLFKNKEGYTLLEVLVALAIMGIAVTLLSQLFSANIQAVSAAESGATAAVKADARLREILSDPPQNDVNWTETLEGGYPVQVSVSEVMSERTENLPIKVMEVALTISWNENLKERKLVLRTLKITNKKGNEEQE
ncbi:MAG: prepilin-type N-terminal cleavage/methylation domain-containing protein [Syntrophaceae bacterium]|nr:prepilin-type N-terminal cleavage/methylation domain-containing protein [Syntrophaceae bacterium]